MKNQDEILRKRDWICEKIAQVYGVSSEEILGRDRSFPLPDCRMMLAYALSLEGYTRGEVGAAIGRDHSTVSQCFIKMSYALTSSGWKDIQEIWAQVSEEMTADKEAEARFKATLEKDSAPAGKILLNIFTIQTIKSNGKQNSSENRRDEDSRLVQMSNPGAQLR